ncbi:MULTISPECIES: formimidoylglutamase [Peptoniphilus]|jgi:formimidoylglutamase|uniref:formimidoylglutamase n=1 Tax=Peptoniphilus TaxID=162289 RepID=UPI0008D982B8|nr:MULTISPECIES: formimidoylglutamase [Peptoniphilus]MBS6611092.1 formimidoylglutamase [Peptoniphilus harei]MDU1044161.1 formimidoylglutamase [Peptoniphilus rhinitidis]MDU1955426.1 formimidoylglutamase [Peptoniphilus lacydonensis]MDU3750637.1 formimidoylglutamase [Peptoniphilus rhinitidis]MDU5275760.1 formimidoylglutamase [Peptoniphilus lacydonensis]
MINYYSPQEMGIWSGRIDDENDYESFRWHQWVKGLDLNDEDLTPFDGKLAFGILGFESDQGIELNKGRFGAAAGPSAIRKELSKLPCQFSKEVKIFDCGNVTSKYTTLEASQDELAKAVKKILDLNLFPIVLGGGHETAFGHYKGLSTFLDDKEDNKLGILNFDAHFDLRPYEKGTGTSGTMFRQISDYTREKGTEYAYYVMGIQKHSNTLALFRTADELGVNYVLGKDMISENFFDIVNNLDEYIKKEDYLYITICMDCFTSSFAPGVSAPQPLGVDPEKVILLLKHIFSTGKPMSFDIAEVSPRFDHDSVTANLASILVYTVISTLAQYTLGDENKKYIPQ